MLGLSKKTFYNILSSVALVTLLGVTGYGEGDQTDGVESATTQSSAVRTTGEHAATPSEWAAIGAVEPSGGTLDVPEPRPIPIPIPIPPVPVPPKPPAPPSPAMSMTQTSAHAAAG